MAAINPADPPEQQNKKKPPALRSIISMISPEGAKRAMAAPAHQICMILTSLLLGLSACLVDKRDKLHKLDKQQGLRIVVLTRYFINYRWRSLLGSMGICRLGPLTCPSSKQVFESMRLQRRNLRTVASWLPPPFWQ